MDYQGMEAQQVPTDEKIGKGYDEGKETIMALFHELMEQLVGCAG